MKTKRLAITSNFIIFFLQIIFLSSIKAEIPIFELSSKIIKYENNNSLIIAEGDAHAKHSSGKEIFSKKIIYNKKNSLIETFSQSTYKDNLGNTIEADSFYYDLNKKIIKAKKNVTFKDKAGNLFKFTELDYNENEQLGIGKNFVGLLVDKSYLKSTTAEFNNISQILVLGENNTSFTNYILNIFDKKNNFYTPCDPEVWNKKKESCPDWDFNTVKTIRDKKEQMVYHYGSIVRIKDVPVFYLPYFSHPDPSVKRKSGFLNPSLKNFTNLGQTLKTPYFWEIDKDQDITFTPIYYFDENNLYLAEYRKQSKNNRLYIDTSYTPGYKNLNKKDSDGNTIDRSSGSRNHFFFNLLGNYDNLLLDKNELEINIQKISQKNYLNIHQINTQNLKQDISKLNNSIILKSYKDNMKINLGLYAYENLNDDNSNTKYNYELPSVQFSNFFKKFDQNINISSSFLNSNKGGDSNQVHFNNSINLTSEEKRFEIINNISNIFKASINHINFYNQNIANSKENYNSDIFFTGALESSYPLIKTEGKNDEFLLPKIFAKYTSGSMSSARSENKILSYSDIYSINRLNNSTNPETGASIGYGIEYELNKKNLNFEQTQKLNLKIGQIINNKKTKEMPVNSTLADTKSSFVGSANLIHNFDKTNLDENSFELNYEYIISNDLNKIQKNLLSTNLKFNKNILTANYYEIREIGNEHYVDIKFQKKLENEFNFALGIKKNLKDSFTENNFIETFYETDCIKISLSLIKNFYSNSEVKPSNNLNFSIILKPFGSPISPNLSSFLN